MRRFLVVVWTGVFVVRGFACAPSEGLAAQQPLGPMRIAVTVDDLPYHGKLLPGVTSMDITRGVLRALKENRVIQAQGFAFGYKIDDQPELIDDLKEWLKAGYPLGNHSYGHEDLAKITAQAYIVDIEKMDRLLQKLAPVSPLVEQRRVYRYPYLDEGDTLEKRDAVRSYLSRNGYRIAEVTIDFDDWAWNEAYIRCVSQHDDKSIGWLKARVVDDAERHLRWSKEAAHFLFGRDIAHILLVHDSAFNAVILDAILRDFRAQGVKFITLDEALADPAYKINPNRAYKAASGPNFLEQIADGRNVALEKETSYTAEGLDKICNEPSAAK